MTIPPRLTQVSVWALLGLVIFANIPGTRSFLESELGSAFGGFAAGMALLFFVLVLVVWLSAVLHLNANKSLSPATRWLWYFVTYGMFVLGAVCYYFRYMRASSGGSQTIKA